MNTVTFDLNALSAYQISELAFRLRTLLGERRDAAYDGILIDAADIAKLKGEEVFKEGMHKAQYHDGYLYRDEQLVIVVNERGYTQAVTYKGRQVWDAKENIFRPSEDWMKGVREAAAELRQKHEAKAEAEQHQRNTQDIQRIISGTEFENVSDALRHFQIGPFEPQPEIPVRDDKAERLPSADDIRREILLAGLTSTADPVIRELTLRLIRKQLRDFHHYDSKLCEAVLARLTDSQEWETVRREAAATAWGWLDSYTNKKAVSAALFEMMGKGGEDARLVVEGMTLLGITEEPVGESYE